jgi:hypothetical protein
MVTTNVESCNCSKCSEELPCPQKWVGKCNCGCLTLRVCQRNVFEFEVYGCLNGKELRYSDIQKFRFVGAYYRDGGYVNAINNPTFSQNGTYGFKMTIEPQQTGIDFADGVSGLNGELYVTIGGVEYLYYTGDICVERSPSLTLSKPHLAIKCTIVGNVVTLDLSGSSPVHPGRLLGDLVVDWGDGIVTNTIFPNVVPNSPLSPVSSISHQYATDGDYDIKVKLCLKRLSATDKCEADVCEENGELSICIKPPFISTIKVFEVSDTTGFNVNTDGLRQLTPLYFPLSVKVGFLVETFTSIGQLILRLESLYPGSTVTYNATSGTFDVSNYTAPVVVSNLLAYPPLALVSNTTFTNSTFSGDFTYTLRLTNSGSGTPPLDSNSKLTFVYKNKDTGEVVETLTGNYGSTLSTFTSSLSNQALSVKNFTSTQPIVDGVVLTFTKRTWAEANGYAVTTPLLNTPGWSPEDSNAIQLDMYPYATDQNGINSDIVQLSYNNVGKFRKIENSTQYTDYQNIQSTTPLINVVNVSRSSGYYSTGLNQAASETVTSIPGTSYNVAFTQNGANLGSLQSYNPAGALNTARQIGTMVSYPNGLTTQSYVVWRKQAAVHQYYWGRGQFVKSNHTEGTFNVSLQSRFDTLAGQTGLTGTFAFPTAANITHTITPPATYAWSVTMTKPTVFNGTVNQTVTFPGVGRYKLTLRANHAIAGANSPVSVEGYLDIYYRY